MKTVPGYEGLYRATEDGNIWSERNRKLLKPYVNRGGYLRVNMYDTDGRVKHEYVHRIIASTFLPNPEHLPEVNHINAKRDDNRVSNLEWCTKVGNAAHALRLGNYARCVAVEAINIETGEIRRYPYLRYAAKDLFGKYYCLQWLRKSKGRVFIRDDWAIICERG